MISQKPQSFQNISVAQFKEFMQKENTVILDVRTAAEVSEFSIPGAQVGLDYYNGEFESAIQHMDKKNTYLIYCRSGVRSVYACEIMAAQGFQYLYNLIGGIKAWKSTE